MDLKLYDWEGRLVCIVPKMQSVNWHVYYRGVGTLEVHMNVNAPQAKTILENKYLLAFTGRLQAVIVIKKIEKHELVLYGRTLNWFLKKRVVLPFEERSRNSMQEVKKCIPEYMREGTFPSEVEELEDVIERTSAETAESAIAGILELVNLGYEVRGEKGADGSVSYVFNVLEGKNTSIVLSEELRNVHELIYTDDMLDYCTTGYYLKDETWTEYVNDAEKEGIYKFEGVLMSENKANAGNELKELRWKRICEGKIKSLKYGEDYELGDIITIRFKRGDFRLATKYRITGIHIWYEGGGEGEEPVFEEVV